MKQKIVYIVSSVDRAIAFEWIAKYLDSSRFELSFILINCPNSALGKFLEQSNITYKTFSFSSKLGMILNLIKLIGYLRKVQADAVHTHLKDASLLGLTAAKLAGVKRRIITRHHSTYHHKYFPKAIKLDRWCNSQATHIVAISRVVEQVLMKEGVQPEKINLIHHGFDLKQFEQVDPSRIAQLAEKHQVRKGAPVLGVIARYIEWKGIQYILQAFLEIRKKFPDAQLVIANAHGPYQANLQPWLDQIPKDNLVEVKFESDLFALYQLFDVFIHCPVDPDIEAFGQIYVEALAAKIPSVFSLSGVAHEFIQDRINALVVPHQDSQAIELAVLELLKDQSLVEKLKHNGKEAVDSFSIEQFVGKLELLYS